MVIKEKLSEYQKLVENRQTLIRPINYPYEILIPHLLTDDSKALPIESMMIPEAESLMANLPLESKVLPMDTIERIFNFQRMAQIFAQRTQTEIIDLANFYQASYNANTTDGRQIELQVGQEAMVKSRPSWLPRIKKAIPEVISLSGVASNQQNNGYENRYYIRWSDPRMLYGKPLYSQVSISHFQSNMTESNRSLGVSINPDTKVVYFVGINRAVGRHIHQFKF